jgi:hypothetical protein
LSNVSEVKSTYWSAESGWPPVSSFPSR